MVKFTPDEDDYNDIKYNNVHSSYLLLYYYYSTLSTTDDDDNVFIYIHMSLDMSVVYNGRNTSVADTIKGKDGSNSHFTSR